MTCINVIHPLWRKETFRYGTAVPPTGKVEVRRSARRRRTVSAHRDGDTTVVMVPARLTKAQEQKWIATMLRRLDERERRRRPSDEALLDRANDLCERYLGGLVAPDSVRWVSNQHSRWASCTLDERAIRLSTELRGMPDWVLDYVLLHELAHLIVEDHSRQFWDLVYAYPKAERARGYLQGVAAAANLPLTEEAEFVT